MLKKVFLLILCCTTGIGLSDELPPQNLQIVFQEAKEPPEAQQKTNQPLWEESCKTLGKYLQTQTGVWKWGVFENITCVYAPKPKLNDFLDWQLLVTTLGSGNLNFELKFNKTLRSKFTMSLDQLTPFELLKSEEKLEHLSLSLLDQLPMAMHLPEDLKEQKIQIYKPKFIKTLPPQSLNLYTLSWNPKDGLFHTSPAGTATFKAGTKTSKDVLGSWSIHIDTPPKSKKDQIWAHNSKGPGNLFKKLEDQSNSVVSLRGYYEFGLPIMNSGLYKNSLNYHKFEFENFYSDYSVTKNLGFRWQFWGTKSITSGADVKSSYSGSRTYLTYNLDIPYIPVVGLRITPLLANWNYSIGTPRYSSSDESWSNTDIKVKNVSTFGIESKVSYLFLRPYSLEALFAYESSLSKKNLGITAYRYGYSLVYPVPSLEWLYLKLGYSHDDFVLTASNTDLNTYVKKLHSEQETMTLGIGSTW